MAAVGQHTYSASFNISFEVFDIDTTSSAVILVFFSVSSDYAKLNSSLDDCNG